jgi:TRAP-type C4-dicarboxylate transport system permease small subunit
MSFLARLKRGAELVAALLFAIMLGAFFVQIVSRYVFNHPVAWTIEVASLAYIWIIFWGAALLIPERQHIIFDLIYRSFRPRARRIVAVFLTGSVLVLFLLGLPGSVDYVQFMARRQTLVLHIPFNLAYACFVIFLVGAIVMAIVRLKQLLGRDWDSHL